jgi:hypothetical protein
VIRPALIIVLLASSAKLLGASNVLAAIAVVGAGAVMLAISALAGAARRRADAQKSLVGADAGAR